MQTKICTKCSVEKSIAEFHKQRLGRFGVTSVCKNCWRLLYTIPNKEKNKKKCKVYYKANRKKCKIRNKDWQLKNKDKIVAQAKKYYKINKELIKIRNKKRYKNKKGEISDKGKAYRACNKEKIKARDKKYRESHKIEYNTHRKTRRRTDIKYKLNHNISSAISASLNNNKKGAHWEDLVRYTLEKLKKHLERQFVNGMSWENYGKWHIDHAIPKTAFNFAKPEHADFLKCWALKNLQPMWAKDNIVKSNKITKHFQPSLLM